MRYITPEQYYSSNELKKFIQKFSKTQTTTRLKFLFKLPMFGKVAEIGVARGNFSECILHIIKPKKLHLIDCWEYQVKKDYLHDPSNLPQKKQDKLYQYVRNKFIKYTPVEIHKKYSLEAAELFSSRYFDWIYLDANHSYKAVKADLRAWYPKVKTTGIIAGNDYTPKPNFGVIRAIDEFMRKKDWEMFLIDDDPWHSWAMRKKKTHRKLSEMFSINLVQIRRRLAQNQNIDYLYTQICLMLRRWLNIRKV